MAKATPRPRTARPLAAASAPASPAVATEATLVSFVDPPVPADDGGAANVADPWGNVGTEAPSNLSPAADWQSPGEYIDGEYLGFTADVGPNQSRLYHLKHRGQFVSVWGSTILDARVDALNPPRGTHVLIQYLGTVVTGRGLNPAKNFRVKMR